MARGNQLVQSPGDRRSPNACRPIPAASSTGTPLDKSLFPGHTVHSDASSEDEGDNSPSRQEHQHSSCDGVPILRGNTPSTPYDQIPPVTIPLNDS
ncbi:hypothetical protein FRC11_004511 [Ceratobasidium sp. 423]|nr:hypothetical protein FRC11_004511 [Ceratobasidium sp. 423]